MDFLITTPAWAKACAHKILVPANPSGPRTKILCRASIPSVDKGQHGFSEQKCPSAAGASPAASSALPRTISAPKTLPDLPVCAKIGTDKAAGRRRADALQARERSRRLFLPPSRRIVPCPPRVGNWGENGLHLKVNHVIITEKRLKSPTVVAFCG